MNNFFLKGFLQAKGFEEKVQNSIKVTRVIDGSEPTEFKSLFNRWYEANEQKGLGRTYNINSIGINTGSFSLLYS